MTMIHLQGIGKVAAKPAGELIVGDILSWNYTYKGFEVVSIAPRGKKSISIVERCIADGKEYTRNLLKSRQVAA